MFFFWHYTCWNKTEHNEHWFLEYNIGTAGKLQKQDRVRHWGGGSRKKETSPCVYYPLDCALSNHQAQKTYLEACFCFFNSDLLSRCHSPVEPFYSMEPSVITGTQIKPQAKESEVDNSKGRVGWKGWSWWELCSLNELFLPFFKKVKVKKMLKTKKARWAAPF